MRLSYGSVIEDACRWSGGQDRHGGEPSSPGPHEAARQAPVVRAWRTTRNPGFLLVAQGAGDRPGKAKRAGPVGQPVAQFCKVTHQIAKPVGFV